MTLHWLLKLSILPVHVNRELRITILDREFGDSPLFALKDPRACRLVPFWLANLMCRGIAPRPVANNRSASPTSIERGELGVPLFGV